MLKLPTGEVSLPEHSKYQTNNCCVFFSFF